MENNNLENNKLNCNEKNLLLFLIEFSKLLNEEDEDNNGDSSWTIFDLDKLIKKYRLIGIDITNLVDTIKNSKLIKEDISLETISTLLNLKLDDIKLSEFIDNIKLKNNNINNNILNNDLTNNTNYTKLSINNTNNFSKNSLKTGLANIIKKAKQLKTITSKIIHTCTAICKLIKKNIDYIKENINKISNAIKTKAAKEEVEVSNISTTKSSKKINEESKLEKPNNLINDNIKFNINEKDKETKETKEYKETKENKIETIKEQKIEQQKDSNNNIEDNKQLNNIKNTKESVIEDKYKKEKNELKQITENFSSLKVVKAVDNTNISNDNVGANAVHVTDISNDELDNFFNVDKTDLGDRELETLNSNNSKAESNNLKNINSKTNSIPTNNKSVPIPDKNNKSYDIGR